MGLVGSGWVLLSSAAMTICPLYGQSLGWGRETLPLFFGLCNLQAAPRGWQQAWSSLGTPQTEKSPAKIMILFCSRKPPASSLGPFIATLMQCLCNASPWHPRLSFPSTRRAGHCTLLARFCFSTCRSSVLTEVPGDAGWRNSILHQPEVNYERPRSAQQPYISCCDIKASTFHT